MAAALLTAACAAAIMCVGGGAFLAYYVKTRERKNDKPPKLATCVSHVRIRVSDLNESKEFYEALGLIPLAVKNTIRSSLSRDQNDRRCLLQSPANGIINQPYVLLEHNTQEEEHAISGNVGESDTSDKKPKKHVHAAEEVGIARICLIVQDVNKLVLTLQDEWGYFPVAPPIEGQLPKTGDDIDVAAYRDPCGNIIELLSFKKQSLLVSFLVKLLRIQLFPLLLHVNVNVSCYGTSLDAYKELGYTVSQDFGRFDNSNLHKALAVPDPGIAAHVSLIRLVKDRLFVVEMMEWEDPMTTIKTVVGTPLVSFAVVVHDVDIVVDQMIVHSCNVNKNEIANGSRDKKSCWRLSCAPRQVLLPPPLGSVRSATILDPDGMPVELISYTQPNHIYFL